MSFEQVLDKSYEILLIYGPKVLMALAYIIIGFLVIGWLVKSFKQLVRKKGVETTLSNFLGSILSVALKVMLLFSVAGMFGINTTSFIAIISALMIGIGMALNGTVSHFASGVMLMIFKPFKVGDLVEIGGGRTGSVEAINAFNTTLRTLDNKKIIIANSNVTGNDIINISGQGTLGVELSFGIAYGNDIDKARKIILDVGNTCPFILKDPAQGVVVGELGASSVNLNTRPFCHSEDYWDTFFYMQENVKKQFDIHGIEIPYNTIDVNLSKD